ncbi:MULTISPECIES: EpsG family protein [Butyricimonas]|uniref:EpsG family protein n=1 Tax=Butyricimonas TaxID=574697 RepID=UPI0007FB34C5|nr:MULTISPECIES: EpsG family protein [Butyricimonas]
MVIEAAKTKLFWQSIFAAVIFVLAYWGINYMSDWEGYEHFFYYPEKSRDVLYAFLSEIFKDKGYSFTDLYKFHILLISFSYICLFKSLKINPILIVLVSLAFNYVAIGNQIRYYLAFPLTLYAFLRWVKKEYIFAIILLIISVLEHKSAIILFSVLAIFRKYLYKCSFQKQFLLILLANVIIFFLFDYSSSFDEKYDDYKKISQISSLTGGVFNVMPYLLSIYSCVKINNMFRKGDLELTRSPNYIFLYTCSIAPTVFLFSGLYIQILANRFIIAMFPIWIAFFIYSFRNSTLKKTRKTISMMAWISMIVLMFWKFCLNPLLGIVDYFVEMYLMLSSYQI